MKNCGFRDLRRRRFASILCSMNSSIYDFTAHDINGREVSMEEFRGKTLLIVNTASKCGFSPQYGELQKLYEAYRHQGLEILGFPCNQFANQEPGSEDDIREFCTRNFGVTFPLFEKIKVNGSDAHPLYKYLTSVLPGKMGKRIKWNFTKFVIAPDGRPVQRFAPADRPIKIEPLIEELLVGKNA